MRRRSLITAFGSLAGAGSLAVGSGAFTSVSAQRSVTIDTADDDSAFLRLEATDGSELRSVNSGKLYLQIPGSGPGESDDAEGVGLDSVYEFHDLITVTNQGTQPVELYSQYVGSDLKDLALITDGGVLRDDPPILDVGESLDVGLYIDTHRSSIGEFEEMLTIVADQSDE
jgi:hypothetical protein